MTMKLAIKALKLPSLFINNLLPFLIYPDTVWRIYSMIKHCRQYPPGFPFFCPSSEMLKLISPVFPKCDVLSRCLLDRLVRF
jgi:hypothetical protein